MKKVSLFIFVILPFLLTGYSLVNNGLQKSSSYVPPMLVIMYDDGPVEDYEIAFPVHQAQGVPGVVCINSSTVNTENNLSIDQLKEMEDAGWEIVNHGKYHAALDNRKVIKNINAGDTRIYIDRPYRVKKQYKYLLYNEITGKKEVVNIVDVQAERENRKRGYVEIEGGAQNSYPSWSTCLRLTEDSAVEEILEGKKELINMGFNVTNYTYSYNAYEDWSKKIVSKYHNAARSNSGGKILFKRINKKPLSKYALYSTNFEVDKITDKKLEFLLGQTAKKGGLTILWAHTWSDNFTQERLHYIIELAKSKNIQITTLQEALNKLAAVPASE